MNIGLDFDNTIACYDVVFHTVAAEKGLIDPSVPVDKISVRDSLRENNMEKEWIKLQGFVYGNAMKRVNSYEGVTEFLEWAKRKNHVCKIISHKTKHPYRGPKYDLHSTAREWIETYFSNSNNILIEKKFIFFHQTKAEKIDHSKIAASVLGGIICLIALRKILTTPSGAGLDFINLNFINFFLFGLGILLHGSFSKFISAIKEAIGGSVGIIIQFPLYAGIMGIMKYSGLAAGVSYAFVNISTDLTLPIYAFLSAGIVNIFVPSGGGQWAVQGPIVVEAAQALKAILSEEE